MLRHERMAVAMALAEALHHSSGTTPSMHDTRVVEGAKNDALRGQKTVTRAREGEVREEHQALRRQTRLLVEVQPQGCVERHVVEDPSELAPMVQILDAPVPQMVDTVLEFFRALDLPVVEQVIAVPKISTDRVSQRLVERRLPQMVETAGGSTRRPSPTLRYSGLWSSTSTFQFLVVEAPFLVFLVFSQDSVQQRPPSRKRISERIVEQIVDPVSRGGLHGSSSSHSPTGDEERADEPGKGFFRTFPQNKKVRSWARTRGRNCSPSRAHPRRLLS